MKNFFSDNQIPCIEFGDKVKFQALKNSLYSFYETGTMFSVNYFNYFDDTPNGIFLSEVRNGQYVLNYTTAIISAHLYLEHTISEVLHSVNPLFACCDFKEETEFIRLLTHNLSGLKIRTNRINTTKALKRLCELISLHDDLPVQFQVPEHYHFLVKYSNIIGLIATLRNDVAHAGEKILDRYAFDLLFVNNFLPLVRKLLHVERPNFYIERNVACGINVIDELIKTPLPEKYDNRDYLHLLKMELKRINQVKELGRASYHTPLFMGEDESLNLDDLEKYVNHPRRTKGKAIASFKAKYLGHHKVHTCPCCGTEALSSFSIWEELATKRLYVKEAECALCSYAIADHLGNPSDFNLMKEPIFGYI